MSFAVKVINHDAVMSKMRKVKLRLDDRTRVNKRAAVFVLGWIQRNFTEQGKRTGGWKALAPSTLLARAKGWGDYIKSTKPTILQNKGKLKNDWALHYSRTMAVLESNADYSVAHDEGKGHVPKRKITPTNKMIIKDLRKIYGHFIRTSLK